MMSAEARDSTSPVAPAGAGQLTAEPPASSPRRNFIGRSLAPMTVNGIRHATLTLATTAMGGGVLSVSYVMKLQGLLLGAFLLVLGAGLAFMSTVNLMRLSALTGHGTYAGLFAHCAGAWAGPVLDAMLLLFGVGSCVSYNVFLGDFIPALTRLARPDAPAWVHSRELAIGASAIAMLPLALQRDLGFVRFVAPISILALMYLALIVMAKAPLLYKEHLDSPDIYGNIVLASPGVHTCEAFALCVFSYNCHLNVIPVAGSMLRPTKARIMKVSARVNALQLAFYSLIGVSGYLSFLEKTPQDIIMGYGARDMAVALSRLLLTFTIFVATIVNLNPTIKSGLNLVAYFRLPAGHLLQPSPRLQAVAAPRCPGLEPFSLESTEEDDAGQMDRPLAHARQDSAPTLGRGPQVAEAPAAQDERLRTCFIVTLVFMQAGMAVLIPGVADVLSILGATVATAMMLTIPAYAMGKLMPLTPKRVAQQVVLYAFSVVSAASLPLKILHAAGYL